jgi:hypothetical protein
MRHKTKFTTRTRIVGGRIFGSLILKMARLIASPVLFIAKLTLAIKLCQSYVKSSWNATCERLYECKKLEEVRLLSKNREWHRWDTRSAESSRRPAGSQIYAFRS